MAAATRRRIVALALARANQHGLRTITTTGLVAPIPDEHAVNRPSI
jgi:hypothetical protein